jgi:DNA-binding NarL/FixJ family response regulator
MVDPFVWNRQTLKRRMEQSGKRLLPRQEQVLSALKAGMTDRQAADALGLSSHTVHSHVMAVYHRMGVKSRAQLLSLRIGGRPPSRK